MLVAYEALDINNDNAGKNEHCFFLSFSDAWLQPGNPPKLKDHFQLRRVAKAWLSYNYNFLLNGGVHQPMEARLSQRLSGHCQQNPGHRHTCTGCSKGGMDESWQWFRTLRTRPWARDHISRMIRRALLSPTSTNVTCTCTRGLGRGSFNLSKALLIAQFIWFSIRHLNGNVFDPRGR